MRHNSLRRSSSVLLVVFLISLVGCNAVSQATATPTRTPRAAEASPAAPQDTAAPQATAEVPQTTPEGPQQGTPAEAGQATQTPKPSSCAGPGTPAPPAATGLPGEPSPTPRPTPTTVFVGSWPHLASPEYGIQAFMWWYKEAARRDARLIRAMGFQWVKHTMAWKDIEVAKGAFDWCRADRIVALLERQGLSLLARLDLTPDWAARPGDSGDRPRPADLNDFGSFCYTIAERYAGRIRAYQVWNEPNLDREWGMASPSPAEYVQLLKVCYENIKKADPHAIVISAGLAPTGTDTPQVIPDTKFVEGMYAAGGAPYFDMLGFNAPGYAAPPEMSPDEAAQKYNGRWFCFRHVEDVRSIMLANNDGDKQIAVLELGWTTDSVHPDYSWFRVDEQTQADYLVRAYQYAKQNWQPWIGLMSAIYIANPDWTDQNEEYWWSITLPAVDPNVADVRPAYNALKDMQK